MSGPARLWPGYPMIALWLLLAVPAAADVPLTGRVVSVGDGDSITVLSGGERHRIRLRDIDAPERGQPGGTPSRRALVQKLQDRRVRIEGNERDRYQRLLGVVWLGARNINREMVREGHAWAYRRYLDADDPLLDDEAIARKSGLGLWAEPEPVAPWLWRRGARAPQGGVPQGGVPQGSVPPDSVPQSDTRRSRVR